MAQFSATDPDRATPRRPRRGWLQFGFATLLKLVALAAVLSAWWADRERLTDRIGRLENDQTVLRIAMGDEVDYTPINRSLGYVGAGAIIGRPVSAYPTTTSPPAANGPSPGTTLAPVACFGEVETSSRDLYVVLHRHKDWLKANFAEDRGWQEFLAKGEPAETAGDSDAPQVEIDAIHATAIKQSLPAVVKLLAANPPHARLQAATLLARRRPWPRRQMTPTKESANARCLPWHVLARRRRRRRHVWMLSCGSATRTAIPWKLPRPSWQSIRTRMLFRISCRP